MKRLLALVLAALAMSLALLTSSAYAQIELTEADPPDGEKMDLPPSKIRLCFSEAADFGAGASFRFRHQSPDGGSLVLPVTFEPDAENECVDISVGIPLGAPAGEYVLEWRVAAAVGIEEGSGTVSYQVTRGSVARETPPPSETPLAETPTAVPSEDGDADDDDDTDILLIALITTAAIAGAAVLTTLGYLLRLRIGYEPHRPSGDRGEASEER